MDGAGNRRGFLRDTLFSAARTTVDAATGVNSARTELKKTVLPGLYDRPDSAQHDTPHSGDSQTGVPVARTRTATATSRVADHDDLVLLAQENGLGARSRELCAVARHSTRITLGEHGGVPGGQSRIGGSPSLPAGHDWPTRQGQRLAFLAQLDLAVATSLEADSPLPRTGLLLLFYNLSHSGGTEAVDAGAAQIIHVGSEEATDPGADPEPFVGSHQVRLSGETVLPRAWSASVRKLALTDEETKAWTALRTQLALHQGIADTEMSGQALHRLFGYPDETTGDMPLACELAARGLSREGVYPYMNPDAPSAEPAVDRWRLLFQLSADDDLGCSWGENRRRLYFWITDEDLVAADFSRVFGILG